MAESEILQADARSLALGSASIDGILFSPPYSFAIDYLANDSFHLNVMGEKPFPRIIGRHVRQWKSFSLEEAVRKCSSLPAAQYGLRERGIIRENAIADIVIFDAEKIIDNARFDHPCQYPDEIETVMFNGAFVWHKGAYDKGQKAGQVIRN